VAHFRAFLSSIVSVVSYVPVHSVQQIGLAVAATVTVERAQLIDRVNMARHENWDTHTLPMDVCDCIRYKNALKLSIHLRSSIARV